jgi:hypothetical protein
MVLVLLVIRDSLGNIRKVEILRYRSEGLTIGGGLTWLYEGNLPIEAKPGSDGDVYGKDWNFRLNIIPVIPGLIQKPLF